jgi:prephenate dehydrogenase
MAHRFGIIGHKGNFGKFIWQDVLPQLNCGTRIGIDRDASEAERLALLGEATDIIVSTPLAIYLETVSRLIDDLPNDGREKTLWLVPTIQSPVVKLLMTRKAELDRQGVQVAVMHPMYGPNSFHAVPKSERHAFQNIITYHTTSESMKARVSEFVQCFQRRFNISSVFDFTAEQHDEIIARSQGLVFLFGLAILNESELKSMLQMALPKLYAQFAADEALMRTFLAQNPFMKASKTVFEQCWNEQKPKTLDEALSVFHKADRLCNPTASLDAHVKENPPISTEAYRWLRRREWSVRR